MILVRDVFRLHFGKARDGVAGMKAIIEAGQKANMGPKKPRLLSDLTGPYYTLVLESEYASMAEYEGSMATAMPSEDFRKLYAAFVPLVESGYREIFTVVS